MSTPRRPVSLTRTDCRILRCAIAHLSRDAKARFKVNATTTRLKYLNRILSELWPGQAVMDSDDYYYADRDGAK